MNDIIENEIELTYKRGYDHNYMVIKGNEHNNIDCYENYRVKMLSHNKIEHLLNMELKMSDGIYDYYYEISGKQPVSRIYEHREIGYEDFIKIISGIEMAYNNAALYMLDPSHFYLDPKAMYMNVETKELALLYYPSYELDMNDALLNIAEYILDKVDHQDLKAVMLAYKLYKLIRSGCFTISEIASLIDEDADVKQEEDKITEECIVSMDNEIDIPDESYDDIMENMVNVNNKASRKSFFNSFSFLNRAANRNDNKLVNKQENRSENKTENKIMVESDINLYDEKPECSKKELYGKTVVLVPEKTLSDHVLVQKSKGKDIIYNLDNLPISIGKMKEMSDIVLNDSSVSRIHAEIFIEDDTIFIKDCNSTNGTFVNGMQLDAEEKISLETGDEISIGKIKMEYR